MDCKGDSCTIKDDNKSEVSLIEPETNKNDDITIDIKGRILLEKLGVDKIYELQRIVDKNDDYAEPKFDKVLSSFTPKTKYFGIYFTASWCGPCHNFYPNLLKFEQEHEDEFSYIVMSCDTMQKEFINYAKGKNWKFVDIDDVDVRTAIQKRFGIGLLPSLVIMNVETRKLVTAWGREAIQYNGQECKNDWDQGEEGYKWWHFFRFW